MKILQVIDFSGWAIGALANQIKWGLLHHDIRILEIHPKELRRNPEDYRAIFRETVKNFNPDIIHFHYWDLYNWLRDECAKFPEIKKVLTHHNQKDLLNGDWSGLEAITCHTEKSKKILETKYLWI